MVGFFLKKKQVAGFFISENSVTSTP